MQSIYVLKLSLLDFSVPRWLRGNEFDSCCLTSLRKLHERCKMGGAWALRNVSTGNMLDHYYESSITAFYNTTDHPHHQWDIWLTEAVADRGRFYNTVIVVHHLLVRLLYYS